MVNINNVSFKYDKELIINNINIKIDDNKILGINGLSGSGKTTLLELIGGLIKPYVGNIYINNKDINKNKNIRKEIGFVFQFPEEQFFEITVKKEIEFALKNFKIENNMIDILNIVGLDETYLNRKIKYLSNGEKRLVAIASILIYNPSIIMFDEPTIGLDYNNRKKVVNLIKKLKLNGKTILLVSHDVDLLYEISDDILLLDKGRVLLYGDKEDVYGKINLISKYNITLPKIILFEKLAKNKGVKLMHTNCINDLIKEVYRNV